MFVKFSDGYERLINAIEGNAKPCASHLEIRKDYVSRGIMSPGLIIPFSIDSWITFSQSSTHTFLYFYTEEKSIGLNKKVVDEIFRYSLSSLVSVDATWGNILKLVIVNILIRLLFFKLLPYYKITFSVYFFTFYLFFFIGVLSIFFFSGSYYFSVSTCSSPFLSTLFLLLR